MTVRLGIIGGGNIGQVHAQAAAWAGSTVAAVCDVDPKRANQLASLQEGAIACSNLTDFLAVDDMPAVVVATPNFMHKDLAVASLESGRDVLLEKPMAMNTGECNVIIDAMGKSGHLLQLGFVCRFAPAAAAAKEIIDEGQLGEIYHIKAFLYRRRGIPGLGKWFTTKAMSGGGALIDIGVHFIDLGLYLTGYPMPNRVTAAVERRFGSPIEQYRFEEMWAGPPDPNGVFDVDDGVSALLRLDGGLTFELNVTWATNLPEGVMREGLLILGEKGGCYLNLWENRLVLTTEEGEQVKDCDIPLSTVPHDNAWDRAWRSEHEYFSRAVENRTPPHPSAQNGLVVQKIIEAMYASGDTGREVEVN